jgi:hypothetical protein
MNFFAIGRDFKGATAAGDELERTNVLFELEQFLRQTDGVRLIVSSGAIFDGDFQGHNDILIYFLISS